MAWTPSGPGRLQNRGCLTTLADAGNFRIVDYRSSDGKRTDRTARRRAEKTFRERLETRTSAPNADSRDRWNAKSES
jgi:hypothetical protein